jgi:hypothetical protein
MAPGANGAVVVIASDSEATQTRPQLRSSRLGCFALLAMMGNEHVRFHPGPSH